MLRRMSAVLILLFVLAAGAWAKGTAHFLALQGEGSASVVVDDATKTAYITDGGKGKASGMQGAEIDGERVLDHLLGQGIERLVVTCSHPHSDHMGGLRAAVRSAKIRNFQELVFIDNDYERRERDGETRRGTHRESLKTIYTKKWGEGGKPPVEYISAWNKDAFNGLAREGAEIVVSNFVYDPKRIGKDIHDESVVTQYEIRDGGSPPLRMVDFDDASTALIDAWNGSVLNVLIVSHHGSENNDMSSILSRRKELGLRDVVIPVNVDNQYNHPSPEVLLSLLDTFKPEHVFLTGSVKGDNIEVTPQGVQVSGGAARNRERLAAFLHNRLDRLQAEAESVIQTLAGHAKETIEDLPDGPLNEAALRMLADRKLLTPEELTLLRRVVRSTPALQESLKIVAPKDPRRDVLAGLGRGLDPLRVGRNPDDFIPEPPESGGRRYTDVLASLDDLEEPPVTRPDKPARPSPSSGGSGAMASMFEEEMRRERPTWGGVMLGNKTRYDGPRPVRLEIASPSTYIGNPLPVIRVHFEDGDTADYADVTSTELWVAFNFIHPSPELQKQYGPIPERAAGLVGAKPREGGLNFAIHPAAIGTHLAREAMRLDISLRAAGRPGVAVPAALLGHDWSSFQSFGYQWFDEEAHIQVRDGRIGVEPTTEPKDCFLRFRVFPVDPDFQGDEFVKAICASFDAYRSVERLAKVVAILNWYSQASGKSLPALPAFVKRVTDDEVTSSLPYVAVFANRPDNQVVPEPEPGVDTAELADFTDFGDPQTLPEGWDDLEEEEPPPSSHDWTIAWVGLGLAVFIGWLWWRKS